LVVVLVLAWRRGLLAGRRAKSVSPAAGAWEGEKQLLDAGCWMLDAASDAEADASDAAVFCAVNVMTWAIRSKLLLYTMLHRVT
jgi:hypothetical protein